MDKDTVINLASAFEDLGRAGSVARGGRVNDRSFYDNLIERRRQKAKEEAEATRQKAIDEYLNAKRGREMSAFKEEDDPESALSKELQSVVQMYAPDKDVSGMPASKLKEIVPYLEKKYNVDTTNDARIAAQQAAIARENQSNLFRQQALDLQRENTNIRRQQIQSEKERKRQEKLDKDATKYSEMLEKTNIPDMVTAIEDVDRLLPKEGDIPGYGEFEGAIPDFFAGDKARELRGAVQTLFNIELKDRSGAAVTDQELERLRKEFGEGSWKTEKQLRDGIERYKNRLKEVARNIQAGTKPEVIDLYKERGGKDLTPFISGQGAFPRKVYKDGKEATVSNEQELKEAQSEGWR